MRIVMIIAMAIIVTTFATAYGDEAVLDNDKLVFIAGAFAEAHYYRIDLDKLEASVVAKDGIVYVIFGPKGVNTIGGGPVVALDPRTGEVLGSEMTQ